MPVAPDRVCPIRSSPVFRTVRTVESVTDKRKPDGYWGVMGAPAHRQVSAVMLLPKPHLWDLRTERWQPQIVRNGSAERPLPAGFMPLPSFAVSAEGSVAQIEGTMMANLAGLPAVCSVSHHWYHQSRELTRGRLGGDRYTRLKLAENRLNFGEKLHKSQSRVVLRPIRIRFITRKSASFAREKERARVPSAI
jgi:hypothetical protein